MSRCTVLLENMEFRAAHGCYDIEKIVGNRFLVTLRAEAEIGDAAEHDDIAGTVNYLALYEAVAEQMACPSDIIENVAWRIITVVKERFPAVEKVSVTVSKLAPPLGGKVEKASVTMEG